MLLLHCKHSNFQSGYVCKPNAQRLVPSTSVPLWVVPLYVTVCPSSIKLKITAVSPTHVYYCRATVSFTAMPFFYCIKTIININTSATVSTAFQSCYFLTVNLSTFCPTKCFANCCASTMSTMSITISIMITALCTT